MRGQIAGFIPFIKLSSPFRFKCAVCGVYGDTLSFFRRIVHGKIKCAIFKLLINMIQKIVIANHVLFATAGYEFISSIKDK